MTERPVPVTRDPAAAARVLRDGGLAGIPTETVYGLAADATNPDAITRVFEVKGRPADHPLILHLGHIDQLADWVADLPEVAITLAQACWPGPLTLLLHRGTRVLDQVTGGRGTVGIRIPAHQLTLAMLEDLDRPVVAPSANRFGRVSPTRAEHVIADLAGRLDADRDVVLDGGECPIGLESTIVDCTVPRPVVLRPGGIPVDDIVTLIGDIVGEVDLPDDPDEPPATDRPAEATTSNGAEAEMAGPAGASSTGARASGMLASHYAPRARVDLVDTADEAQQRLTRHREQGEQAEILDIDDVDDLIAYAHNLYAALRDADRRRADVVVAIRPPPQGLGFAIRDRLTKAAATRPR